MSGNYVNFLLVFSFHVFEVSIKRLFMELIYKVYFPFGSRIIFVESLKNTPELPLESKYPNPYLDE